MQQTFPAVTQQTSVALIHCATKYWRSWNTCKQATTLCWGSDLQLCAGNRDCINGWLWSRKCKKQQQMKWRQNWYKPYKRQMLNLQNNLHTSTQRLQLESTFSSISTSFFSSSLQADNSWDTNRDKSVVVCLPAFSGSPLISAAMFFRALSAW